MDLSTTTWYNPDYRSAPSGIGFIHKPDGSEILITDSDCGPKDMEEAMDINLYGALKAVQWAYPVMRKTANSAIVLFSTVAVTQGMPFHSVVASAKGAVEGFSYSTALSGFGGVWDYHSLNAFLAKPKAYISGTKMNFAGLKKPQDRANMIAYLRQQADAAAALPTAEEIAAESES